MQAPEAEVAAVQPSGSAVQQAAADDPNAARAVPAAADSTLAATASTGVVIYPSMRSSGGPPPASIATAPEMNPNRTITVQTKHGPIEVPVPGMAFDDGGQSTVYVANVNQSITIAQIEQFFRAVCGEVLHSRMMDDPDAAYRVERSKCAFVQFKSKDQADLAITLSGTVLGGMPIKVGAAKNPIVPVQSVTPIVQSQSHVARLNNTAQNALQIAQAKIMEKLKLKKEREEADKIRKENSEKVVMRRRGDRSRSRSRDKRRSRSPQRRRSRSRDRRLRRSRSRSRGRSRHDRHPRRKSRSRSRKRSSSEESSRSRSRSRGHRKRSSRKHRRRSSSGSSAGSGKGESPEKVAAPAKESPEKVAAPAKESPEKVAAPVKEGTPRGNVISRLVAARVAAHAALEEEGIGLDREDEIVMQLKAKQDEAKAALRELGEDDAAIEASLKEAEERARGGGKGRGRSRGDAGGDKV